MNVDITKWALRHGVSAQALYELDTIFGIHHNLIAGGSEENEASVQANVRLEASRKGAHLFRNNVGVLTDKDGRPVRYGLANDSAKLNKVIKSSDLIGWRKLRINHEHVGQVVAQFISRECKRPGWTFKNDEREVAQLKWLELVNAAGGDGKFCTGAGTL